MVFLLCPTPGRAEESTVSSHNPASHISERERSSDHQTIIGCVGMKTSCSSYYAAVLTVFVMIVVIRNKGRQSRDKCEKDTK